MTSAPEVLALTPQQRGVYFLHCLAPDSAVYHVPIMLYVRGRLDTARLERAIAALTARHEALRLTIEQREGLVVQVVHPADTAAPVPVRHDWVPGVELADQAVARASEPFDLARGPLWRVDVLSAGPEEHALAITFHHLVIDEVSASILAGELSRAYDDAGSIAAEPDESYREFCAAINASSGERALDFWRSRLAGLADLPIPEDPADAERGIFEGDRVPFRFDGDLAAGVTVLCRKLRVSEFMVFHAVLVVLLSRWTGSDDVAVGTPMSGRTDRRFDGTVGFFQNTVVLRTRVQVEQSFEDLLKVSRRVVLEALSHQSAPFESVVAAARPGRTGDRNPLFQVALVYNRRKVEQDWSLPGLEVRPLPFPWPTSHFDLTLTMLHEYGELHGNFAFSARRLLPDTALALAGSFEELLRRLIADPTAAVRTVPMTRDDESTRLAALAERDGVRVVDAGGRLLPAGLVGTAQRYERDSERWVDSGERGRIDAMGIYRSWTPPSRRGLTVRGDLDVENTLIKIFEEILGVPGVGRDDDFFDYGGHSMLAVRLVGRIAERFGWAPAVAEVMQNPTPAALAARMFSLDRPAGGAVRLAEGEPGTTVAMIHPAGGTLLCYQKLVARLPGATVVGIERVAGIHPDDRSYAALVERYADDLRAAAEASRLTVVGWSLGGVIAHSVAARLERLGAPAAALVMLDSLAVGTSAEAERMLRFADDLGELAAEVRSGRSPVIDHPDRALLMRRLGVDSESLAVVPAARAAELIEDWGRTLRLVAECRPEPVATPTELVLCADNPTGYPEALRLSWEHLCVRLTCHSVPGDHTQALSMPAVEQIAAVIAGKVWA